MPWYLKSFFDVNIANQALHTCRLLIAQIEFSENDLKSFQSFPQATHWEGQTPLCFLWCCFSWQNQIFVWLGNRTDIQNMWTHCANRIWLKIRHLAIAQKEFELSSLVNDPLRKKNLHCVKRITIAHLEFPLRKKNFFQILKFYYTLRIFASLRKKNLSQLLSWWLIFSFDRIRKSPWW